jgi:hypothetical protein
VGAEALTAQSFDVAMGGSTAIERTAARHSPWPRSAVTSPRKDCDMFQQHPYFVHALVEEHQRGLRFLAERAELKQVARRTRRRQRKGLRPPVSHSDHLKGNP